ncbi:methyltransferase domain-containing protein [Litoricolaceae bacterium]|nr:methyltransferase domain-containing protein [Litorivicinaceae bacterium]
MAVQSVFRLGVHDKQRAWDRWVGGRLGHRIQVEERRLARRELRRLFGQVVLQVGGTAGFPLIADSLAPVRLHVVLGGEVPKTSHCPVILAEDNLLPFPTDSVDILVLQHSLDISAHPHQVLREAERVLRPGGRLLLFGFNPASSWGLRKLISTPLDSLLPWHARFMRRSQIEDWCRLLNLVPELSRHAVYSLPLAKTGVRKLFKRIEHSMARKEWPIGAVYCLRAKKERNAYIQGKPSPLGRFANVGQTLKPAVGMRRKPILRVVQKPDDASSDWRSV